MTSAERTPTTTARTDLVAAIESNRKLLGSYLPPHVAESRFIALATRAVLDNADVMECTTNSVLRALGAAAASGLPIDGKMSSLVVRRQKNGKPIAVWDPSYRGMVYLALESGHVQSVEAHAVHEGDHFAVELGTDPRITHQPNLTRERGEVVAAYAVATLKTGGVVREVLGADDLKRIKATSPAGDRGPWGAWPDRMAMKSAMRRLLKRLPAADIGTLGRATAHVAEYDDGEGESYQAVSGPVERPRAQPQELTDLEARALAAISEAETPEQLTATWGGILTEFRQVGAEVPVRIEAARFDREEALRG